MQHVLDWADQKHDFCLKEGDSDKLEYGTFPHTPKSINAWALALQKRFKNQQIAICLEFKAGPIVSGLQRFDFITLFFVPPSGLAKYRQAFVPSGAKGDPTDAFFQLEFLIKHAEQLREVKVDSVETRIIQQLVEHRKFFVDERVAQTNRITAALKNYYPLILQIFSDFVTRWPNLSKIEKAKQATLEKFFKSHHSGRVELIEKRIALIKTAMPLTDDQVIITTNQRYVLSMIAQLKVSLKTIASYDKQIATWFSQHEDQKSLYHCLAPVLYTLHGCWPHLALTEHDSTVQVKSLNARYRTSVKAKRKKVYSELAVSGF